MIVIDVKSKDELRSLTYTIQNIVIRSSLSLDNDLALGKINSKINNTEYNPERFPGLFIRFKHPKCVTIVFRNGKLILTGLKQFNHIDLVISRLILKLNEELEIDINKSLVETEVVNIVITANFYKPINLDRATVKLENAIYEPEVFPGLVYRISDPIKSIFLIFSTGKVVFTGIRNESVIKPALVNLGRLLDKKKLFLNNHI
jgi:transcription initiation factor TFIID TATA-box-binding protein